MNIRSATLFSGIGAPEIAASWLGWKHIFWCEINKFGQQVLKHHFPDAKGHEDIKTTDFTIYKGRIDVLTGGFPCQPYSAAGKRKGKEDERHLWPEMLRAIREIRPCYVVGENVRGLVNWSKGLVFDEVQADLEAIGYEVTSFILPACAVNAPHRRDRIFIIAYSSDSGIERMQQRWKDCICEPFIAANSNERAAESSRKGFGTEGSGGRNNDEPSERGEQAKFDIGCSNVLQPNPNPTQDHGGSNGESGNDFQWDASNTNLHNGCYLSGYETCVGRKDKKFAKPSDIISNEFTTDSDCPNRREQYKLPSSNAARTWKELEGHNIITSNTNSGRQPSEEHGQTESGRITEAGISSYWENFPTQSPIRGRNDGIPNRMANISVSGRKGRRTLNEKQSLNRWVQESIKAYGNAIVPQVIYEIYKVIDEMLKLNH